MMMSFSRKLAAVLALLVLLVSIPWAMAANSSDGTLKLPAGLKEIGYEAFMNDTSITDVVVPRGVTYIGSSAFYDCTSLESVDIPGTVELIDSEAFYGCSALTQVTLREGIREIEWYAFEACTALTEITLPSSLEYIGYDAFYGCDNLKTVHAQEGTYAYTWAVENGYIPLDGPLTVMPLLYDGDVSGQGDAILWDHLCGGHRPGGSREIGLAYRADEATAVSMDFDWGSEIYGDCDYDNDSNTLKLNQTRGNIYLELEYNHTGQAREGHIVFSSENHTVTVTIRQLPYLMPELTAPSELAGKVSFYSYDSIKAVFDHDDLVFTWSTVPGATAYDIGVNTINRPQDGSDGWVPSVSYSSGEIKGGSFSFKVDKDWLDPNWRYNDTVWVAVHDAYGHVYDSYWHFEIYDESAPEWQYEVITNAQGAATNGIRITRWNHFMKEEAAVPGAIDGHPVKEIDGGAFENCNNLTKVVLPNTVESIDEYAFEDCLALALVVIPGSVNSIHEDAFYGCPVYYIDAPENSYAYNWALERGLLPEETDCVLESEHPYDNDSTETWTYIHPEEADGLKVTFSKRTSFEKDYDKLRITDANGETSQYTGRELSGATLTLPGNRFTLQIDSDGSVQDYGFRIVRVEAVNN